MSLQSILNPIRPVSGVRFGSELWVCTSAGEQVQDISESFLEGSVSINWLGTVKATMSAVLKEPVTLRPLIDWLMPRIVIDYLDESGERVYVNEPLGVFTFHFPDQVLSETHTIDQIEGMDGLWLIGHQTNQIMRWAEAGRDYGSTIRGLLNGLTSVPLQIPDTGKSPGEPINITPAENLLDVANALADRAGMWDLAATRTGTVTTSRKTVLGQNDPKRVLQTSDAIGEITRQPDRDAFFNRLYLASNSPDAYEGLRHGYVWEFVDPDDPYSTANTDVVARAIFDVRDETVEDLDERARLLLQTGSGVADRYTIEHIPDPRFDIREDWYIDIRKADGSPDVLGTYQVEAMEFGLTPDSCAQVTTVSRLVNANLFAKG